MYDIKYTYIMLWSYLCYICLNYLIIISVHRGIIKNESARWIDQKKKVDFLL